MKTTTIKKTKSIGREILSVIVNIVHGTLLFSGMSSLYMIVQATAGNAAIVEKIHFIPLWHALVMAFTAGIGLSALNRFNAKQ